MSSYVLCVLKYLRKIDKFGTKDNVAGLKNHPQQIKRV